MIQIIRKKLTARAPFLLPKANYSTNKTYTTEELVTLSNRYLLGVYNKPNIILSKGKGAIIEDLDGRQYLDMTAGIAVTSLGHGVEELGEILNSQANKVLSTSNLFHNEYAGPLAEQLVKSTRHPDGNEWGHQVFFTNSGTEANEAALKFSRKVGHLNDRSTKYGITTFRNAFHGRSLGALSVTPKPAYQEPFEPLLPGIVVLDYNCSKNEITRLVNTKTTGVIVEPIQGEGGVNVADELFLKHLRTRCDEVGAVLIYDEIQCGLSRTGKLWAHHHYPSSCAPDILTMAKPLGNGFPIGAVVVNERVAKALAVGDHGTTFGGNPLGCRLGLAVLEKLSHPDLLSNVQKISKFIIDELNLFSHPNITEIRGKGLILGVQFDDKIQASQVCAEARKRSMLLITCGNNAVRLVPSLSLTMDQAKTAMTLFKDSVLAATQPIIDE